MMRTVSRYEIVCLPSGELRSIGMLIDEIASLKRQLAERDIELFEVREQLDRDKDTIGQGARIRQQLNGMLAELDKRLAWCERLKAEAVDAVNWLGDRDFPQIKKALKAVLNAEPKEATP